MRAVLPPLIFLVLLLGAWQFMHTALSVNSILLPSPLEVAGALNRNWERILNEVSVTMLEAFLGFGLGAITAYGAAAGFVILPLARRALLPYAIALKATPLIVLAPLIVMWAGNGIFSKVVMAALVAFFPVLINSLDGLLNVPHEQLELMRSLSATRRQTLTKVRMPNSLPYLFSGLRTASSLAVVGAIIGEFTGSIRGAGHLINTASYYLDTDIVFATIFCISLAGVGFYGVVVLAERILLRWRQPDATR